MANLDLLENSIPVAPLKLAALPGSMEMAKKVDSYLVQFRKELAERRNGVSFSGYSEDSFLIEDLTVTEKKGASSMRLSIPRYGIRTLKVSCKNI